MPRAQSIARLAVTLTFLLLLSGTGIPAQAQNEEENRLRMYAGELFEILAVHKLDAPEFTWVLAKERQFVEAGRERVFRYRFIDPGMYLLDATVADEDGAVQLRTSMQLEVTARKGAEPLPSGEQQTLLASEPAALHERVTLLPGQNIIRLLPKREGTQMFAIDTNANHDGNGDGNPANDDDNIDSAAHEDSTPLFLWLTEPGESLHMIAALLLEDGRLRREDLTITWEEQEPPELIGSSDIILEKRGAGTYAFSLPTDNESTPLLTAWDFGDGTQSMLDEPVHEYTGNGAYQVRAVVKDLRTGADIRETSVEVIVDDARPPEEPVGAQSSSSVAVPPPSPPPEEPSEPSALREYLLILIPLGIGLLAVLALVVWLLRRLTGGGGLQQRLEEAEAKIMEQKGEEGKRAVIDVPPPLQIKREPPPDEPPAPPPAEPEPEPEQPSPPSPPAPPAEPTVDLAAAPPWLQQGLAQEEKPTPPLLESAAPVQTEPVPSAPAETPAEPSVPSVTPAPTEPASEPAPLPPWLQPPEETVETQPSMQAVPPESPALAPTEEKAPPESPPPAPAQTAAAPAPAATLPTEERSEDTTETLPVNDEAAERERERKRQKRQRYRENVRKRKQAAADTSDQKQEEQTVSEKPETPSAPSEALPPWLQSEPEQSSAAPSVQQPESTPPPATDQKPSASAASAIEPSSPTPAPIEAPAPTPPVVQDIPPAEPSLAASTVSPKEPADGDVAFLIKAESVSEDNGKKPDEPKKAA